MNRECELRQRPMPRRVLEPQNAPALYKAAFCQTFVPRANVLIAALVIFASLIVSLTGTALISLHEICQPALLPSVRLWAVIWQLCMTKPQNCSWPRRCTCAVTSKNYYITVHVRAAGKLSPRRKI